MDPHRLEIDLDVLRSLESELPLDELFNALADEYTRYTLYYLSDQPTVTLEQLADVVAGIEATTADAVATPADHGRIRIHLYHITIPRLEELGYVDFDPDEQTVTRATMPPAVRTVLGMDSSR